LAREVNWATRSLLVECLSSWSKMGRHGTAPPPARAERHRQLRGDQPIQQLDELSLVLIGQLVLEAQEAANCCSVEGGAPLEIAQCRRLLETIQRVLQRLSALLIQPVSV
jgi:hypothetical protein